MAANELPHDSRSTSADVRQVFDIMYAKQTKEDERMANGTKLVTLPKEVAEAIEQYIAEYSKETLLSSFCDPETLDWIPKYAALSKIDLECLMSALVNGYQVETTPEDQLREYYESLFDANRFDTKEFVLVKTLNILGISIPGVNAK